LRAVPRRAAGTGLEPQLHAGQQVRTAMPTRRTFVTGLLAGLGAASPAAAQFGNLLQQLPGGGGGGGGGLDLNRLLGAAGSIFEGMQLGEKDEIQMAETMYGPLIDQSGGAYK